MALDLGRARRRLTAAGIEEDRADAVADVVAEATGDLATKQDIAELEAATKQDLAEVKKDLGEVEAALKKDISEIKEDIAELKVEIAKLDGKMEALIGKLEGKLFRGLWIQGGTTVAILAGLYMIASLAGG